MPGPAKRFLICGLGSIGRRHLSVLRALVPDAEIAVLRRPGSTEGTPEGVVAVHHMDAALALAPTAAIIATPAPFHLPQARALAVAGVHLLVEKPLSHAIDGAEHLIGLCRARGVVLQVGYCLRFDPALAAVHKAIASGRIGRVLSLRAEVGRYLPKWRPGTDWRAGTSARRDLGGGVLLELSHEIDLALWLCGAARGVSARLATLGGYEIDVEDTAQLSLELENGAVAELHMDMLDRAGVRTCRVVGGAGTVLWDGLAREARIFEAESETWQVLATTPDPNPMYHDQMRRFLDCVAAGREAWPSGADGAAVLRVVEAARKSAATGQEVML